MAANITQYETLRNPQFASRGMVNACAMRKMADMERKGLKLARKAAGLTQQQIADRMGVSVQQVSCWENGVNGIPSQQFNPPVTFTIKADKVLRIDRVISWGELLS